MGEDNWNGWQPPLRGLIHVTGEPDTGKTWFALTVPGVMPGDIIFFDDDVKSKGLAKSFKEQGLEFGYYVDLKEMVQKRNVKKPLEFFNTVMDVLLPEAIKAVPNAKVLVWDNWSPRMEEAIRAKFMTLLESLTDISAGQARAMGAICRNLSNTPL